MTYIPPNGLRRGSAIAAVYAGGATNLTNVFMVARGFNTPSTASTISPMELGGYTATINGLYYDDNAAGTLNAGGDCGGYSCTAVNVGGGQANYFKNTHAVAPISSWETDWNNPTIWHTDTGVFPTLLDASVDPLPALNSPSNPNFTQDAVGQDDHITLHWEAPGDDYWGGDPITGYQIRYRPVGGDEWSSITVNADVLTYTIPGLTPWGTYEILLQAINAQGPGSSLGPTQVTVVSTSISTCEQLQAISNAPDQDYTLTGDIDCSATAISDQDDPNYNANLFNGGAGFTPIDGFTGSLSGSNGVGGRYTISNLSINGASFGAPVGLFSTVYNGSYIHDLNLTGVEVGGMFEVGGLIGETNGNAIVENVSVGGTAEGLAGVGMLAGATYIADGFAPTFSNITTSGTVLGVPDPEIPGSDHGGLIGYVESDGTTYQTAVIHNINSSVDVSSEEYADYAGGLIGEAYIVENTVIYISDSTASGNIDGKEGVGGIVGVYYGNRDATSPEIYIENTTASGDILAQIDGGGLVGKMEAGYGARLSITGSAYTASGQDDLGVYVDYAGGAGGLVGGGYQTENGFIEVGTSYVSGPVANSSASSEYPEIVDAGGLFGHMEILQSVYDSYVNSDVLAHSNAGGIAGESAGTNIDNVYTVGTVNSYEDAAGGLFGYIEQGDLSDSFSAMAIDSMDGAYNAALIGSGQMNTVTVNNLWYDQYRAGNTECYYDVDTGVYKSDESCNAVNIDQEGTPDAPDYFKQNSTNQPFSDGSNPNWDFDGTWGMTRIDGDYGYPVLRSNPEYPIYQVVEHNITDCEQLQEMKYDLAGDFTLANDINCYETQSWNNEGNGPQGFEPVGSSDDPFTGTFDGQGHEIRGLSIYRSDQNNVGLFGVTDKAQISRVTVNGEGQVEGGDNIGVIIGTMRGGSLTNSTSQTWSITGGNAVGGVVGRAVCQADDQDIEITGAKNYTHTYLGELNTGGIVGEVFTSEDSCSVEITRSRNYGDIDADSNDTMKAGGIVGRAFVFGPLTISDSRNQGYVRAESARAGGIAGEVDSYVTAPTPELLNNTNSGDIRARDYGVGGIVGYVGYGAQIYQNSSLGVISGGENVGGLVGSLSGRGEVPEIDQSYADGVVTYSDDPAVENFGGLVGYGSNTIIKNSFSTVGAFADGAENVGGLVGTLSGDAISNYAAGDVTGGSAVGGLIGHYTNSFTTDQTGAYLNFASGPVTGTGPYQAGLIGNFETLDATAYANYYDQQSTTQANCFADFNGDPFTVSDVCDRRNAGNTQPDYFKNNNAHVPFVIPEDGWDFDTVWTTKDADYPQLRWMYTRPVANITSCQELQAMRFDLNGTYTLNGPDGEIDCTDTKNWNGGDGFLPVGDEDDPFVGTLDGNGNAVIGLAMNSEADNVGLFGVTQAADISSFSLQTSGDSAIVSTDNNSTVGAVVGQAWAGTILGEIYSTTPVVTAGNTVGGIVGVINCNEGDNAVAVTYTTANGRITYRSGGEGGFGGLIGFAQSDETDCDVTVDHVTSLNVLHYAGSDDFGGDGIGGLIGGLYTDGGTVIVSNANSSSTIDNASESAGGLVGTYYDAVNLDGDEQGPAIRIQYSTATGSVTIDPDRGYAGGLVGEAYGGQIADSTARDNAVRGGYDLGGLVGSLWGDDLSTQITRSYAKNIVTSTDDDPQGYIGGLVGEAVAATIKDTYANTLIHAQGSPLGGFAGFMEGDIINSYAASVVSMPEPQGGVGGLIGFYNGTDTDAEYGLLHNFSTTILDLNIDEDGASPTDIGGIVGSFNGPSETSFNLNTNRYDQDRAGTNACAWEANVAPHTYFCPTRSYTTFQGNDTEEPFVMDGDRNWDFIGVWLPVVDEFPQLRQLGAGIAYNITTCQELQDMSRDLEGHFTLANNINCHDEETDNDASQWNMGVGFLPVGSNDEPFTGTFDGQGHTIEGLYTNSPISDQPVGLFGVTNGASVENVIFSFTMIGSGSDPVGVAAGVAYDTNFYRVGVNQAMIGAYPDIGIPVGGIVGIMFGTPISEDHSSSNIEQSFVSDVQIMAGDNVGGLVGVSVTGSVVDSYFDGSVTGEGSVGGIAGVNDQGLIISSYAAGTLTADTAAGGLVGANGGFVVLSFAAVHMDVDEDAPLIGGLIGLNNGGIESSYYDREITGPFPCSDVPGDCTDTQVNGENSYPDYFFNNTINPPFGADGPYWNFNSVWSTRVDDYPVLQWATLPTYDITTCAELQNMNNDLGGDYVLMNDIDCSDTDNFTPIGRGEGISFTGSLDGQGYSINNLAVIGEDDNNIGLFGQTEGAWLHDFTLRGGFTAGAGSVGAVVGKAYDTTTIDRVGNHSSVYGAGDNVGGLVGSSDVSITITDSYNQGSIEGARYTGGLLGWTDHEAVITRSYNAGSVSGMGDVGGIAGFVEFGTIDSTFNAASVMAGNDHAAIVNHVGEVYFTNNYVDDDRSGEANCISNVGNEECHHVNNNENPNPSYFFNNTTNAPFGLSAEHGWDFDGTWLTHRNSFPTLGIRTPYTITDCAGLAAINTDLNGHYTLAANIGPCDMNSRATDAPFTGVLDGNGFTLSGSVFNTNNSSPVGLFATVQNAEIRNLYMDGVAVSNMGCGGSLAGTADGVDIFKVTVTNAFINSATSGGLIGCNDSYTGNKNSIEESAYTGTVNGAYNGGLIGHGNYGGGAELAITKSLTYGDSEGTTCGGLVGQIDYEWLGSTVPRDAIALDHAQSQMDISCNGSAGGLVGYALVNGLDLDITGSSFMGTIDTNGASGIGGLIGDYESNGHSPSMLVRGSYVEASIVGGADDIGGLFGLLDTNTYVYLQDSYFKGDIELSGYKGGGLVGTSGAGALQLQRVYSAGTLTSTNNGTVNIPWNGGLIGYSHTVSITSSFSAMNMVATVLDTTNGIIGGVDPGDVTISDTYYNDANGACFTNLDVPVDVEGCTPVDLEASPDEWIANNTDDPIGEWSFGDTWHIRPADYPSLSPSIDPQVQCEELTPTETTLNATCSFLTTDGLLYGATTWEMRYSVLGSEHWYEVALDGQPYFDQTITGLTPGTQYRIEFRYTDDRGTSEWLHIDGTTLGTNSGGSNGGSTPVNAPASGGGTVTRRVALVNDATGQSTPAAAPDQKIMLNDFQDYLYGAGKQLNLTVGQVIYFNVGDDEHSATVKEIGADYVILTLRSTPFDIRLNIGQTGQYDVTEDNVDDIKITLNAISNGVVTLTFAQVWQTNMPTSDAPVKQATNWLLIILIISGLLFLMFILLLGKYSNYDDKHRNSGKQA